MGETLPLAPWLVVLAIIIVGVAIDLLVLEPRRWRLADEYARSARTKSGLLGVEDTDRATCEVAGSEPIRDAAE